MFLSSTICTTGTPSFYGNLTTEVRGSREDGHLLGVVTLNAVQAYHSRNRRLGLLVVDPCETQYKRVRGRRLTSNCVGTPPKTRYTRAE